MFPNTQTGEITAIEQIVIMKVTSVTSELNLKKQTQ